MGSHRIDRLSEDVKRELTDIFRSLKDPRIEGMLSIVNINLSNDLSSCKVYVSSLNGLESAFASAKALNNAAGYIRRELASRIEMRRSPQLKFVADNSIEHSADIAKKLEKLLNRDEHPGK